MFRKMLVAAITASVPGFSFAADFPPQPAPPPAPPPSYYDWTGVYLGAAAGYGATRVQATATSGPISVSASETLSGAVAGGLVGANYQTGALVLGIEADGQWTGMNSTYTSFGVNYKDEITWYGTVRGRIGGAIGPVLIFGSLGGGYAGTRSTATFFGASTSVTDGRGVVVASIGVDWAVANNFIIRFESMAFAPPTKTYTSYGVNVEEKAIASVIRFGMMYKFGGGWSQRRAY
jgi:outer membrane immunogenic protein